MSNGYIYIQLYFLGGEFLILEHIINYFYVFCDDFDVNSINSNRKCVCFFPSMLEELLAIIMINEFGYKYCHVFKTVKPLVLKTDIIDGNIDVPILLDDIYEFSRHITTYSAFDSNFSS